MVAHTKIALDFEGYGILLRALGLLQGETQPHYWFGTTSGAIFLAWATI